MLFRSVPFTEAEPVIREALERREAAKMLPDYINSLETGAGVQILDEKLKTAKQKAEAAEAAAVPDLKP